MSKTNLGEFPLPYGLACDLSSSIRRPASKKLVRSTLKKSTEHTQGEITIIETREKVIEGEQIVSVPIGIPSPSNQSSDTDNGYSPAEATAIVRERIIEKEESVPIDIPKLPEKARHASAYKSSKESSY
jgi:hypothetical protein